MHLDGELLDALAQFIGDFSKACILVQQFDQLGGLIRSELLALLACVGKCFPVLCISFGVSFVAIRLSCLRKQDQRGRIGGLETESKVQENERV